MSIQELREACDYLLLPFDGKNVDCQNLSRFCLLLSTPTIGSDMLLYFSKCIVLLNNFVFDCYIIVQTKFFYKPLIAANLMMR